MPRLTVFWGVQPEATTDASSSRAKPKSVVLPSPAPSSDTHHHAPQRNSAKPPQSVDASPTGNQDGQCPGGEQPVVPKAPAKKKRGRPPSKDLLLDAQTYEDRFATAPASHPLFWGAEQNTQISMLKDLRKQVSVKTKTFRNEDERDKYLGCEKVPSHD